MSNEFLDAVSRGDVGLVKRYLADGVDVNFHDYSGPWSDFDATDIAAKKGDLEMLQLLLDAGARNRTFVEWGIHSQHADVVREWLKLDDAKELINIPDGSVWSTKLMGAARGSVEIVRLLVEGGANVDDRSLDDESPLDIAVDAHNTEVINYLWPLCSQETRERAGLPNDPRNPTSEPTDS